MCSFLAKTKIDTTDEAYKEMWNDVRTIRMLCKQTLKEYFQRVLAKIEGYC
jgi:hypothetical protein